SSAQQAAHARAAVEPLAAPHQDTRAPAQAVEVHGRNGARTRRLDLTERHALAEADDRTALFVRTRRELADVRHAQLGRRRLPRDAEQLTDVLGDRKRCGQPGRTDAADTDITVVGLELIVVVLRRGADADVHRRDVVPHELREDPLRLAKQVREAERGGRGVVLALDVFRRRPDEDIAEHGRRDEHALARAGRNGEHDVIQQRTRELVEDEQLAAPRPDGEAVIAEHPVDLVAEQTRGVDDEPRTQLAARRFEPEAFVAPVDPGHTRVQAEVAPREYRLRGVGERRRERTDHALAADFQRALRGRPELPLAPAKLGPAPPADL